MPRRPVASRIPLTGAGRYLAGRNPTYPESASTRLHAGVDLAAPRGTSVRAPEAGRVVIVQSGPGPRDVPPPWRGYGPALILLRGDSGVFHLLSHLEHRSVIVSRGARVAEGEVLGKVGPQRHVHWEVRRYHPWRPRVHGEIVEIAADPASWLAHPDAPSWYADDANAPCPPQLGPRSPRRCREQRDHSHEPSTPPTTPAPVAEASTPPDPIGAPAQLATGRKRNGEGESYGC